MTCPTCTRFDRDEELLRLAVEEREELLRLALDLDQRLALAAEEAELRRLLERIERRRWQEAQAV